ASAATQASAVPTSSAAARLGLISKLEPVASVPPPSDKPTTALRPPILRIPCSSSSLEGVLPLGWPPRESPPLTPPTKPTQISTQVNPNALRRLNASFTALPLRPRH